MSKKLDFDKLQKLSDLARECCTDCGQDWVWFHMSASLNSGTIEFGFNWKSAIYHLDFKNLDEGIKILEDCKRRISNRDLTEKLK